MAGYLNTVGIGTLYINGENHGFSEKYIIKTASTPTLSTANTIFTKFVQYRRLLLGLGTEIVWARTTMGDTARRRLRAIDAPVGPLALSTEGGGIASPNEMKSALHISFETAGGQFNNRLLRGLRDGWFAAGACTVTPTVPADVTDGVDDQAGLTAAVALGNFIRAVIKYTRHVEEDEATPGSPLYADWSTYVIRGVTSRDTGRPFGCGRGRRAS